MRKLSKQVQPRLVAVNPKVAKRERKREAKALKAAKLERSIEGELLERLKSGVYGDIYNFPEADFNQALDGAEKEAEDNSGEEEEESEEEGEREFVEVRVFICIQPVCVCLRSGFSGDDQPVVLNAKSLKTTFTCTEFLMKTRFDQSLCCCR